MPEQSSRPGGRRHGLRLGVLALVLAAGALWAASRVSWVQVRTVDELRGVRILTLTGQTWAAELTPLALTVLAAVAAAVALRGAAVRILGAVLVAVGVAAVVPAVQVVSGGTTTQRAGELVTSPSPAPNIVTSTSFAGPALALIGALLTLIAAALLLRSPGSARGLPARYQTPAVLREQARARTAPAVDDDVSERLLWDALDAGRDPTAASADGDPSRAAPHPPRDADHRADTVRARPRGLQPGEASEGSATQP